MDAKWKILPHLRQGQVRTSYTSKFKSFQRSLNLWGFLTAKRTSPYVGREHGCRFHPLFVRGQPELCYQMQRTRIKMDTKVKRANALQDTVSQITSDNDEDSKSRASSSSSRYAKISESEEVEDQDKKHYKNSPLTSSNAKNSNAPTAEASTVIAGASSTLTSFSARSDSPAVLSDVSPALSALLVQILVGLARLARLPRQEKPQVQVTHITIEQLNALTSGVVQQQLPHAIATRPEATSLVGRRRQEQNLLAETPYSALFNELQRRELLATARTDLHYASQNRTSPTPSLLVNPDLFQQETPSKNLLSSLQQAHFR